MLPFRDTSSCELWTYLADLNEQAQKRYERIIDQMKAAEGVTEVLLALPLVAVLALVKWTGIFLIHFSALWFNLFAGLCFLVAVLGYPMQVCTGQEAIRILIMGFVSFLIPVVADGLIAAVATVQSILWGFICS